jgi:signal transduction histidine kinase
MPDIRKSLSISYAIFATCSAILLTVAVNSFARIAFDKFVKNSIEDRTAEIHRVVGELYINNLSQFNLHALESVGMLFTHEGYIIDVCYPDGATIWDARDMDMDHCLEILGSIQNRMETKHGYKYTLEEIAYPIYNNDKIAAELNITTFGPIFYTELQENFLSHLNALLITSGIILIISSILVSLKIAKKFTAAEIRQGQFMRDIAHELRTPLTCLQGNIEALIDGVWDVTPERLESCDDEIKRLSALIDDINTLQSFEWDKIKLNKTDFDISKLLSLCVEQFHNLAREKNIALKLNAEPVRITADYDRVKQVCINIISNAVKYTESGFILIEVKQLASGIEISFSDTGIGISELDAPHIFERFYRASASRNSRIPGSGLGLNIANAIIRAHGGVIRLHSKPNEGSTFTIRL